MQHKLLFLLFFLLLCHFGHAQSVGLVLSGGGAKGLAHIGVIKVLEENNIPIDYIAGTSAGAIVAGLYSAGYTTAEMEELFKSEDFYFWSTGRIQKEYRYYFKHPDDDPSWLELSFTKRADKVKLLPPTNFVPQQQMDFAFMELTASTNAACNYDFDSLMVPFLCVAADVNSGKPVVLRKGNLGEAIRASMTVPLIFKPIEIDGRLLFDGGILNNFPHDIMKDEFVPDIIIGHKVADDQKKAESDDVMQQVANIVMRPTEYEIKPEDGILLESEFKNVGLLDFDKIESIIPVGVETTNKSIEEIRKRIKRRVSAEDLEEKRRRFNNRKPGLIFQNIQVEGIDDPMQRKYIIQSIKRKYNVVTLASLKREYFKLVADEHIKSIRPISMYNKETGYFDLHLKVEPEKKVKATIGGNISTKPINQGYASMYYRTYKSRAYTLNSNIYFGRFYSSFKFGGRIDYPTKIPFYLSLHSIFNRWDYFSSSTELFFEDVQAPFIVQNENNHSMEIGFPLGLHGKMFGNLSYTSSKDDYYEAETVSANNSEDLDVTRFNGFVGQFGVEYNNLNYKQYATEGSKRFIYGKYVSGTEILNPGNSETRKEHDFFYLKAHSTKYFNLGKRFTMGSLAEAVFQNKSLFLNYPSTLLNAAPFFPTPHGKSLFLNNFRSNNYLAGGIKTLFHFNSSIHFRLEGYGFVPIKEELYNAEQDVVYKNKTVENYYLQGMAALIYQTGFGPISLTCNYYEKSGNNFFVTLNFGYTLFNKRAL